MRRKNETEERLVALIEPALDRMGLELIDLELKREAGGKVLRVFIDSPNGVTLDTCADASNLLSETLDEKDPIVGPYSLEVSSPGIERPLTKKEHFKRFLGERVRVKTYGPVNGRKDFTGILVGADENGIRVKVDSDEASIEYAKISKANLKPELNF
ncbi:MAG: ribosome maturation factor RimP [Candidatus Aquicultorales bacterium]